MSLKRYQVLMNFDNSHFSLVCSTSSLIQMTSMGPWYRSSSTNRHFLVSLDLSTPEEEAESKIERVNFFEREVVDSGLFFGVTEGRTWKNRVVLKNRVVPQKVV